jgi:hypothetical protein
MDDNLPLLPGVIRVVSRAPPLLPGVTLPQTSNAQPVGAPLGSAVVAAAMSDSAFASNLKMIFVEEDGTGLSVGKKIFVCRNCNKFTTTSPLSLQRAEAHVSGEAVITANTKQPVYAESCRVRGESQTTEFKLVKAECDRRKVAMQLEDREAKKRKMACSPLVEMMNSQTQENLKEEAAVVLTSMLAGCYLSPHTLNNIHFQKFIKFYQQHPNMKLPDRHELGTVKGEVGPFMKLALSGLLSTETRLKTPMLVGGSTVVSDGAKNMKVGALNSAQVGCGQIFGQRCADHGNNLLMQDIGKDAFASSNKGPST